MSAKRKPSDLAYGEQAIFENHPTREGVWIYSGIPRSKINQMWEKATSLFREGRLFGIGGLSVKQGNGDWKMTFSCGPASNTDRLLAIADVLMDVLPPVTMPMIYWKDQTLINYSGRVVNSTKEETHE